MTKHFVDVGGKYLGGFDGSPPPTGSIEVPTAPTDGRQIWSGSSWDALEPNILWQKQMDETDGSMPRYIEDIIGALDAPTRARIATETITNYNDKKTLRSNKPT